MNPFYTPRSEKHGISPESRTAAASRSWVCGEADAALNQAYSRPNLVVLEGITKQPEPATVTQIPEAAPQASEPIPAATVPEQTTENFLTVEDARRNVHAEYIRYLTESGESNELAA